MIYSITMRHYDLGDTLVSSGAYLHPVELCNIVPCIHGIRANVELLRPAPVDLGTSFSPCIDKRTCYIYVSHPEDKRLHD